MFQEIFSMKITNLLYQQISIFFVFMLIYNNLLAYQDLNKD